MRLVHERKANFPIAVTESGIVTDVRLMHSKKVFSPIEVTESGIVIDLRLSHSLKAVSQITTVPLRIEYSFRFLGALISFFLSALYLVLNGSIHSPSSLNTFVGYTLFPHSDFTFSNIGEEQEISI